LPSVINNLARLQELFTSADLWGLPSSHCQILSDPSNPSQVLDIVHEAARVATETLLVYYAGHGLLDPHTDELYLALPESSAHRLYTGVRFEDLRRELVDVAEASAKVVILDCCYSGRAMLGGMSGSTDMADQARIEGTYLMTASAENVRAQAPIGEDFTAFTGELATVLGQGLPDGPDYLTAETIYWHVRKELVAKRRPVPQQRAGNDGGMIALARNRRGLQSPEHGTSRRFLLPEPPAGFEQVTRQPPREVVAETARLREIGCSADADQVLAAVAARRPDQEVAALIAALAAEERGSEVAEMIRSAVRRSATEVMAIINALHEIGAGPYADHFIRAAACGSAEDVGAVAEVLHKSGHNDEVSLLLDTSVAEHQASEDVIALVGTLLSAGFADEVNRVVDLAAARSTGAETVALADALRGAGRQEAAFRLYGMAFTTVAGRPPEEIVSVIRAMRDAGRDDDARRLLDIVRGVEFTPSELTDLLCAFWGAALDDDADAALSAAAVQMNGAQIAELAALLRIADRHQDALGLCIDAAAKYPVPVAISLIESIREAGRPIDANRVLDSSGSWPPVRTAELISRLRAAGDSRAAERVLSAVAKSEISRTGKLIILLRENGADSDAEWLLSALSIRTAKDICDLIEVLRSAGVEVVADGLLADLANRDAEEISHIIDMLYSRDRDHDANLFVRHVANRGMSELGDLLRILREHHRTREARFLVSSFVATRPVPDLVNLATELQKDNPGELGGFQSALEQRSAQDIAGVIVGIYSSSAPDVSWLRLDLSRCADDDIMTIIAVLQEDHKILPQGLLSHVAKRRTLQEAFTLALAMHNRGLEDGAGVLVDAASRAHETEDVISLILSSCNTDADGFIHLAARYLPIRILTGIMVKLRELDYSRRVRERRAVILEVCASERSASEINTLAEVLRQNKCNRQAKQLLRLRPQR
jgi:hypothetical protein